MKMKLTVLACAALFGLTACSSGGDSGVNYGGTIGGGSSARPTPPAPNPNPAPTPNPNPNPNPAPAPAPAPSAAFNGVAIPAEGSNGAVTPVSGVSSSSLDSVTVNGINIKLTHPNLHAGRFLRIAPNTEETIASGSYLSHMRFGTYRDFNHNGNANSNPSYAFALGSLTPVADVPTTGTATYEGIALGSPIGGGLFDEGTSRFNVDFGEKKLNGEITVDAIRVPLTANINGNQFSGTSEAGVNTNGRFYGPQAAEMGGVFNGEMANGIGGFYKWIGSYGAKKQ